VLLQEAGLVRIQATQVGDSTYAPAEAVERSFCVNPKKPIITIKNESTAAGFTLLSGYSKGNQWILDGHIIEGATDSTYQVREAGSYSLQVTVEGCSTLSEAMVLTANEKDIEQTSWTLYPNPSSGRIQVSYQSPIFDREVNVYVYTMQGSKLAQFSLRREAKAWQAQLNLEHLLAGQYVMVLEEENKRMAKFFIKK